MNRRRKSSLTSRRRMVVRLLDEETIKIIQEAIENDKTIEIRREHDKIVILEVTKKLKTKVPVG